MKIQKGEFGYFASEKKRRLIITLILFAIPLAIFFTGLIRYQTRLTVFTVIAVVGCLPACKSAVGLIMMLMRKSMDRSLYEKIKSHAGDLEMTYEMFVTFYDKSAYIDAFAFCGNEVVGYSSSDKIDSSYMAAEIQKILRGNGFKATVRIVRDLKPFLERLDSLRDHRESLEKDIPFTPDERYPDLSRTQLMKHTLLAICL